MIKKILYSFIFTLTLVCSVSVTHAEFSYQQQPVVTATSTGSGTNHSVQLHIVSTTTEQNMRILIEPSVPAPTATAEIVNFTANVAQTVTFSSLRASTHYQVSIRRPEQNSSGQTTYVPVASLGSFITGANGSSGPVTQPTTTSTQTPTTSTTITQPNAPIVMQPVASTNNAFGCTAPEIPLNGSCKGAGNTESITTASNQCYDGIDNDQDGKGDHYGINTNADGIIDIEPDPSCFSPTATIEKADDVKSSIIPCTDKCTFTDVFRLLNNFLTFFITTLLIPLFIIMIMYAGYKYIAAGVNGGAKANVKKMFGNMVLGIVIILCSWLIVRTIMTTLLNQEFKDSGVEFLEE